MSQVIGLLRTIFATAAATASGLMNVATARRAGAKVALEPGHAAPFFTLQGSDGFVYRLADMIGRHGVVLAWFPKAFTGG